MSHSERSRMHPSAVSEGDQISVIQQSFWPIAGKTQSLHDCAPIVYAKSVL